MLNLKVLPRLFFVISMLIKGLQQYFFNINSSNNVNDYSIKLSRFSLVLRKRISTTTGGNMGMQNQIPKRLNSIVLAVSLALGTSASAFAQTQGNEEKDNQKTEKSDFEIIMVTGTRSSSMTVLESAVAVTTLDETALLKKAPRSTADALELIPGFVVEDTGGEVSNNYLVRGLPGGSQRFVQILEDGLPVKYANALVDAIVKYDVTMDRIEAIRGGTSGILTVQGAGAAVNFISKPIDELPEGVFRVTGSNFNTRKAELYYGSPIGNDWYGSVGGYYRADRKSVV